MKKHTSKKQTTRKGTAKETFAFYIGIDLGDKKSDICVLDEQGELHDQFRLRMNAQELQTYFGSLARSRVAMEAGAQSRWVAEVIERCGHQVYVSNTRQVPYIHQSDTKNDPGEPTSWRSWCASSRGCCIPSNTAARRRKRICPGYGRGKCWWEAGRKSSMRFAA